MNSLRSRTKITIFKKSNPKWFNRAPRRDLRKRDSPRKFQKCENRELEQLFRIRKGMKIVFTASSNLITITTYLSYSQMIHEFILFKGQGQYPHLNTIWILNGFSWILSSSVVQTIRFKTLHSQIAWIHDTRKEQCSTIVPWDFEPLKTVAKKLWHLIDDGKVIITFYTNPEIFSCLKMTNDQEQEKWDYTSGNNLPFPGIGKEGICDPIKRWAIIYITTILMKNRKSSIFSYF